MRPQTQTDIHPIPAPDAAFAAKLWSQSRRAAGTGAETYLRRACGYLGELPPSIRYLPHRRAGHHPHAMIARFGDPSTPIEAVQIFRLSEDSRRRMDKRTVGFVSGFPIILAPARSTLSIAIDFENALSILDATGGGAWAAGSAKILAQLARLVPETVRSVVIAEDSSAFRSVCAVAVLADDLRALGTDVRILKVRQRCGA